MKCAIADWQRVNSCRNLTGSTIHLFRRILCRHKLLIFTASGSFWGSRAQYNPVNLITLSFWIRQFIGRSKCRSPSMSIPPNTESSIMSLIFCTSYPSCLKQCLMQWCTIATLNIYYRFIWGLSSLYLMRINIFSGENQLINKADMLQTYLPTSSNEQHWVN